MPSSPILPRPTPQPWLTGRIDDPTSLVPTGAGTSPRPIPVGNSLWPRCSCGGPKAGVRSITGSDDVTAPGRHRGRGIGEHQRDKAAFRQPRGEPYQGRRDQRLFARREGGMVNADTDIDRDQSGRGGRDLRLRIPRDLADLRVPAMSGRRRGVAAGPPCVRCRARPNPARPLISSRSRCAGQDPFTLKAAAPVAAGQPSASAGDRPSARGRPPQGPAPAPCPHRSPTARAASPAQGPGCR